MGLDMYAMVRNSEIEAEADFPGEEGDSKLHYWRKHPNLHGWMGDLYREKGGIDDSFNLVNVKVTLEDLDELEEDVRSKRLPHHEGFFFGQSDWEDHLEDDLAFIEKARRAINEGKTVYYTSWW